MTTQNETGDFSFALGGLAGNNAQGAGFLAAALDAKMTPRLLSCTSGQIFWTYLYLTALKQGRDGDELEQKIDDYLAQTEPFSSRDANLWRMALIGKPGMMRLVTPPEWALNMWKNGAAAARKMLLAGPKGFALETVSEIWPDQVAICQFSETFFQDIADAFNGAEIAIAFNAYNPKQGREIVHMNERAFKLHNKSPGQDYDPFRSRTSYAEITKDSVRDGLWIYQYGFAGREAFDGCYFRQTMLSEAALTPTIFVSRPINHKWIGKLPETYIECEDLKTEVFMNGAYQGERDKIELINKLIEQNLLKNSKYKPIFLEEVEIEVQRGYFDYVFEDKSVFAKARAEAAKKFREYRAREGAPQASAAG